MSYPNTDPNALPISEAEAGARLALANAAQSALDNLGTTGVVVPRGYAIEDVDRFAPFPLRKRARVTVDTVVALERYLARFRDATVAVFAQPEKGRYEAVLDYHTASDAFHGDHRCTLQLVATDEWTAWSERDGRKMRQVEFAEFVETHLDDIAEPASGKVLDGVRHIQAVRNVEFKSKVDLDKGDFRFQFASETKGAGEVFFPERVTLALSPFEGTDAQLVQARVRFRVNDEGQLSLWYQLLDADDALRRSAEATLAEVEAIVGADRVFLGSLAK